MKMKQIFSLLKILFKTPVRIIFDKYDGWIQHNTNHLEVFGVQASSNLLMEIVLQLINILLFR
jgi:hypothetical protein